MFKWEIITDAVTTASPSTVWKLWTKVGSWPTWSHDLEWAMMEEEFKLGSSGTLKPKGWPASKFIITTSQENKQFETVSKLPFTQMSFDHKIIPEGKNCRISYHVTVKGLLAPLLYFTMRPMLKKGLPENIRRFAEQVGK